MLPVFLKNHSVTYIVCLYIWNNYFFHKCLASLFWKKMQPFISISGHIGPLHSNHKILPHECTQRIGVRGPTKFWNKRERGSQLGIFGDFHFLLEIRDVISFPKASNEAKKTLTLPETIQKSLWKFLAVPKGNSSIHFHGRSFQGWHFPLVLVPGSLNQPPWLEKV